MRTEVSAGGIVFRRRGDRVELCLMLDDYGVWTFPKGRVERGETFEQAALREVREEVGLSDLRVVSEAGAGSYRFARGGDLCQKTVHWYLLEADAQAEVTPSSSERVHDAGWFPAHQALTMVGYRNLRPLLRRALRHV